jgi:hypothetical protein
LKCNPLVALKHNDLVEELSPDLRNRETTKLAWGDVDVAESQFRLQRRNVKGQIASRARWVQVPRWLMDLIEDTCPLEDRTAERPVFGCTTDAYRNVMDGRASPPGCRGSPRTTCATGG